MRIGSWRAMLTVLPIAVLSLLFAAAPAYADNSIPAIGAWPDEPATGLYPEQRSCVDTQTWWTPTGGNPQHFHLGTCLPDRETLNATVTPTVTFWVRAIMHDNPGRANYISMVFKTTATETTVQKCYLRANPAYDRTCAPASATGKGDWTCAGTCTRWLRFEKPLSLFDRTGLQEIRFRGFVPQPNSKEMRVSLNAQTFVVGTGKPLSNVTRLPYLRGKGWYTMPYAYCEAGVVDGVPGSAAVLPDGPVSGIWSPVLRQVNHDESRPVTHHFVTLDPDFHAVPPVVGTVLRDAAGPLPVQAVPVDTTALSNGVHRLYQRASCEAADLGGGTNEGVTVFPFVVRN